MRISLRHTHEFIERQRQTLLVIWLVGCAAIIAGSLIPALAPPEATIALLPLDKLLHFGAYGVIALLPQVAIARPAAASLTALSMMLLGGAIELAQVHMAGRMASLDDALVNAVGVFGGMALGLALRPRAA